MKKTHLAYTFLLILTISININLSAQTVSDSLKINNVCLDYLEGWYSGDAERMEKALHQNLVKRRIVVLKQTGGNLINQVTSDDMIEYTKAGFGKHESEEMIKNEIDIDIMHIYKGIAMAKAISKDYVDYLHIGKFNGEWKIVNVLWDIK